MPFKFLRLRAIATLAPDEQVPVYDDGQEMLYHGERILLAELDEHPPHVVTHDGALYGFDDRVEANRFLAELQKRHTAAEVYDPGSWDVFGNLEAEFSQMLADERKRVKSGSYDTYALDLSRNRGSYVGQRSSV